MFKIDNLKIQRTKYSFSEVFVGSIPLVKISLMKSISVFKIENRSMGQEDMDKETNFDYLKNVVEDAIKTKNICAIERIEDEHKLRYMQKYAELLVSTDEITVGIYGFVLTLIAIGISYLLVNPPNFTKLVSPYSGFLIIMIGLIMHFLWKRKYKPDIEFIHEIILKIEEKLPTKLNNQTIFDSTSNQTQT